MTENGAIKYFYKRMELGDIENDTQQSAYEMAVDVLEEIQKYRALGTVEKIREELDRLRTDNECQGLYFTLEERQDLARQHKELEAYKALGTIEELSIVNEKQIPKKPKSTHIKYGKHTWAKKENGEVDDFAWDYEYHNGVYCEVCGKTVCIHCNPKYDKLTDCECEYYSCPSCGKKIFPAYKCCDCGQKIDWSDSN